METMHKWYQTKGFCVGPMGFPMPSDSAKRMEALLKQAEANGFEQPYQRWFVPNDGERLPFIDTETKGGGDADRLKQTVLLTASSNEVDRDNEVVWQKGISLKEFRDNPVMAWAHNTTDLPPIGYYLWAKVIDDRLKAFGKIADRPADYPPGSWFPETIYHLVAQKVVRGVSIGFIPLEGGPPTEKEIRANPSWASARRIIRKSAVFEISLCPVGANGGALVDNVDKGFISESEAKALGFDLPTPVFQEWTWSTEDVLVVPKQLQPEPKDDYTEYLKSFVPYA